MYINKTPRKLDSRGRLVIPARIRRIFQIDNGEVEILTENDLICIRAVSQEQKEKSDSRASASSPTRGTSLCNRCICSSCTGFGCPWIAKHWRYQTDGRMPNRCHKCAVNRMETIHDCDFYTSRKRKRFYTVRRVVRGESRFDVLIREVRELRGLLEKETP